MLLQERITQLKREVVAYSNHVEEMVRKSIGGLLRHDLEILNQVIGEDEALANRKELEIDERCTTLIAQYEPKAKDLRTVLTIFRMNSDLERIADHGVNIAEKALFLVERPPVKPLIDLPRMAEIALGMLKDSISSFINEDDRLAQEVLQRDNIVDAFTDQILRELITFMSSDPGTIERSLSLIMVSRNLRAHTGTNMKMWYLRQEVVKHTHQEEELTLIRSLSEATRKRTEPSRNPCRENGFLACGELLLVRLQSGWKTGGYCLRQDPWDGVQETGPQGRDPRDLLSGCSDRKVEHHRCRARAPRRRRPARRHRDGDLRFGKRPGLSSLIVSIVVKGVEELNLKAQELTGRRR